MRRRTLANGLRAGRSYPIGASLDDGGANFSLYSRQAGAVELLLFDHADDRTPARVISFNPEVNRTFSYWHIFVHGVKAGQIYAYRVDGSDDPDRGQCFHPDKVLLDPYSRGVVTPPSYDRERSRRPGDNTPYAMKSVLVDVHGYDWEGDAPLRRPFNRTIIYEMHVRGFTRHPSSGLSPELRGTYAGLVHKIPYLVDLGITAVELMPVFQFDAQDAPPGTVNYWGYSPISFFAPHVAYSSQPNPQGAMNEFRDMVKALHRAGIEVILDVVYNHTAEGSQAGPTFCFRGIDNEAYYILEADKRRYANYSGTGNTLNANHSVVRRMILDSLHYWAEEMHVDGFRFDLASILSRDSQGHPLANPPILYDIENDPVLAGTKLIAEAWDAGGLYQVGNFAGDHWKEWNGHFRDDVRSFVKSDPGMVEQVVQRFFASPDIYGLNAREPEQSINFVTCHDGFTLNDLVSYNEKHNWANGEENRDGHDDNRSWNCGAEGPSDDPEVESLRARQVKNFFTLNLLALGVPMILMGDEVRRTQSGNNNAYCQDNEISWFDWSLVDRHADLLGFVRQLVRFRRQLDIFRDGEGHLSLVELLMQANIERHGIKLHGFDGGYSSRSLAVSVSLGRRCVYFIATAYWEALEFELPMTANGWRRIIDTALPPPADFNNTYPPVVLTGATYVAQPRSVVVLVADSAPRVTFPLARLVH